MQDHNKFIVQVDNSKADEAAGKMMVGAMVVCAVLFGVMYIFQTLERWYNSTALWLAETGDFLAGFWPF